MSANELNPFASAQGSIMKEIKIDESHFGMTPEEEDDLVKSEIMDGKRLKLQKYPPEALDITEVTLLHYTPWTVCAKATRTCWDSHDRSDCGGDSDYQLITRVGKKLKHESVLEHIYFTFYIEGISRACLQELARHRMASLSVKSTRYTLKELKREKFFYHKSKNIDDNSKFKALDHGDEPWGSRILRANKYAVLTGFPEIDSGVIESLDRIIVLLHFSEFSIDEIKYVLPEAYRTNVTWTINVRSLSNFIRLRTAPHAFSEIRSLAYKVLSVLPPEYEALVKEEEKDSK